MFSKLKKKVSEMIAIVEMIKSIIKNFLNFDLKLEAMLPFSLRPSLFIIFNRHFQHAICFFEIGPFILDELFLLEFS